MYETVGGFVGQPRSESQVVVVLVGQRGGQLFGGRELVVPVGAEAAKPGR